MAQILERLGLHVEKEQLVITPAGFLLTNVLWLLSAVVVLGGKVQLIGFHIDNTLKRETDVCSLYSKNLYF